MALSIGSNLRAVFATCAVLILASCGASTLKDATGYVPDQDLLDQVVIGLDTQDTVARILGRPGTTGIVDDRGWYYVQSDYERFLWRAPVEVDREVVAVSFAENGQVTNIERFGIENGQVIALNRRVTDSNTQGIGFLRQLFSNFGNLNPGSFLEES